MFYLCDFQISISPEMLLTVCFAVPISRILPDGSAWGAGWSITALGCRRVRGAPSPRGHRLSRPRCGYGLSVTLSSAEGVPEAGVWQWRLPWWLLWRSGRSDWCHHWARGQVAIGTRGTRGGCSPCASARPRRGGEAANWIAGQVAASAIVACDPAMCAALHADGLPATRLLVLGTATADPLGSDVVVATLAVRNQFGTRLQSVYAPVVIASFGTGAGRIDIRAIAPDGTAAYRGCPRRRPPQPDLRGQSAAAQSAHHRRRRAPGTR